LHLDSNLDVWSPPPVTVEIDASGVEPMDDDQFWLFIDVLDGRTTEKSIARLAAALSRESEETILAFAQAADRNLLELDDPALTRVWRDARGAHADPRWSEAIRGAAIAGGRSRFDLVRGDAGEFDRLWTSDGSSYWRAVSTVALWRKRRTPIHLITSYAVEAGSNAARWEGFVGDVETEPYTPAANVVERHDEDRLLERHYYNELAGHDRNDPMAPRGSWFGVRFLVVVDGRVREVVQLDLVPNAERAHSYVQEYVAAAGAELVAQPEVFNTRLTNPMNFSVFQIRRRSTLSEQAYRAKYGLIRPTQG
jgi:hypothetical protein